MAYIFLIRISWAINLARDVIKPGVAKLHRKIEEIKHGKHSVVTSLLLPIGERWGSSTTLHFSCLILVYPIQQSARSTFCRSRNV